MFSGTHNLGQQVGINSGTVNNYFNSQADQASSRPRPSSNVPFRRDKDYVDRSDILARIDERCSQPAGRAALVGFGGFGKSQLAIEYAHCVRQRSPNTWIFWVFASNLARLESFNDIAERVGLCLQPSAEADIIPIVCKWLCNESNGRWLMIVDNIDDEITVESQQNRQGRSLALLLPQSNHGAIVITSRNTDVARSLVGRQQDIIMVDAMSEDEAVQLLQNKLGDRPHDHEGQLVKALDCIPLAIVQAAAYINRLGPRRMPVTKYLSELKEVEKKVQLLQKAASDLRRDGMAQNSVLATWQISFEHILQKRPSAAYLLSFMSFFNPQGIPEFMIHHYTDKESEGEDDSSEGRLLVEEDEVDFEEDMAVFLGFSLVGMTKQEDEFEMHGLVQLATRVWLRSTNVDRKWFQTFTRAMAQEFPSGNYESWPKCRTLLPHVLPIVDQEDFTIVGNNMWPGLLYNASWYAQEQGLFAQAEVMALKSLKFLREDLNANESDTLPHTILFGTILMNLGKYGEAESIYRKTLATSEKLFGLEHPKTLTSINNLAEVLVDQGKYEEAESMHSKTLVIRRKLLGLEHPNTLTSMNNLAMMLEYQGKYEEAESILRKTLVMHEKLFGLEHPDTLTSMNNLAEVLSHQSKYEEAGLMQRKTLETSKIVFGFEHPNTLVVMNNLSTVLVHRGEHDEAESISREMLAVSEKLLGLEHPKTLASMNNLAEVLRYQSKYEEAKSMHRKTLVMREKLLGLEHPSTLASMKNLARVLRHQGKYDEAESML